MKRFHAKRFLGFFMAAIIMCGIFAVLPQAKSEVSAAVSTDGNWEYEPANNAIVKYLGKEKTVVIPANIDGSAVTSIGAQAFYNNNTLASVTIPASVISVGNMAFAKCGKLTSAYFQHPNAAGFILGNAAFDGVNPNFRIVYFEGALNFGSPVFNHSGQSFPAYKISVPAELTLTADYVGETIKISPIAGTADFTQYSYVVEINGQIKHIEPVYCDTLNISSLIPSKEGKSVRIAIVRSDAAPDYSRKGINIFAPVDVRSNTITLSPRFPKMNKKEIAVDYETETLKETNMSIGKTYEYRAGFNGKWQSVTLNGINKVDISNFRMGGVIEIRRAAAGVNSAGPSIKLKIAPRPKTPDFNKISMANGIFKGVTNKMQFSTTPDRLKWHDIVGRNLSINVAEAAGVIDGGIIFFRIKATVRSMKSATTACVYISSES